MLPSSVGKKIILKEVFPIAGITWKKGTSLATWNGPSLTNYLSQIFFFFNNSRYWHILAPLIYTYHGSLRTSKQINKNLTENIRNTVNLGQDHSQPAGVTCPTSFLFPPLPHPHVQGPVSTRFFFYLSKQNHQCTKTLLLNKSQGRQSSGQSAMNKIPGSPLHHFLSPSIVFKKRVSHRHSKENKLY